MKVTLISPPYPFSDRGPIVSPILEYLGALTLKAMPGTELYEEYRPFLLADRGWEYYTGASAVFEHPELGATDMERLYYKTSLKLMSPGRIFRHIFDINLKGFPTTHLLSLMKQIPVRRAMKKAYGEWAGKMPKKAIKSTC